MIDAETLLLEVHDETSFLSFLKALAADWEDEQRKEQENPSSPYGPGANGWENGTIGGFLERASSWALDSAAAISVGIEPSVNAWARCAQILLAGKYYE